MYKKGDFDTPLPDHDLVGFMFNCDITVIDLPNLAHLYRTMTKNYGGHSLATSWDQISNQWRAML